MKHYAQHFFLIFIYCFISQYVAAQKEQTNMSFVVTMEKPASQYYHVVLRCNNLKGQKQDLKIPAWTPGYYQIMNYAKSIENFTVAGGVAWNKPSQNIFSVLNKGAKSITVSYDVKASTRFVANAYLDDTRGYIVPGALFLYLDNELRHQVTVQVKPYKGWTNIVATGLDSIPGKQNTFYANNFDVLYDSPFLMGELESLPPFYVKGKAHYFIGYQLGAFDRKQFMADLKKIVESSVAIIGDVPYNHYTFLAIGPGMGGIEHLNSTSLSFSNGEGFDSPEGRKRLYSFIAHEYFHHYNVKRIRPVELGPFDYAKENKTNMLWVSEGFTVYYEYLILKRAGLTNEEDVLKAFQSNIIAYENKPGHLFQSATQASYDTWSDGPFGRIGDEVNKTISYYDKGPVLGLMLDFKIRHETNNKQSLDDVMRLLYKKYYQIKKRGFTEAEFQMECEKIAGTSLTEVFSYAATVMAVNYPKYFAYAGLTIDTVARALPGIYFGATTKYKDSSLIITSVEWNSPAWNAGLREKDIILETNEAKAGSDNLSHLLATKKPGDTIKLLVVKNNNRQEIEIALATKFEKPFTITALQNQTALQKEIYQRWLNNY